MSSRTLPDLPPRIAAGAIAEDEQSRNAMGGTEMMKYGLHERLTPGLRDQFQFICSRVRDDQLDPLKKRILWLHDMWSDAESGHLKDPASRARFSKLVFVSNYQFATFHVAHGVPYAESVVLRNAIEPIEEHEKPADGSLRLIYHTTPHRGLELLVPAFRMIAERMPNVHLDVYSSFNVYGWPKRDLPFEPLFEECRRHPQITYHGYRPNDVVRAALKAAHIFAYPSVWPETSCIAAMEAMSAGCVVVTSSFGALPETTAGFADMYPYTEDHRKHLAIFTNALYRSILDYGSDGNKARLRAQKGYADRMYCWDNRIVEWEAVLRQLL